MSVIGRLDEQVDAVLISPLDRSGPHQTEPRQRLPDEPAPPPHPGLHTPEESESSQNKCARREALPVWLL